MPRPKRPSEVRGWFRVSSEIIHDPAILEVGHHGLATFVHLMAMANRAQSADGHLVLSLPGILQATGKHRRDVAEKSLRSLAEVGLISSERRGEVYEILIRNWLKYNAIGSNTRRQNAGDQDQDQDQDQKTPRNPPSRGARARVNGEKSGRRKPKTPVPDQLDREDRQRVIEWAAKQDPPISVDALRYAWAIYLGKARANDYRYVDHVRGFMNALSGERWALRGYESTGEAAKPKGQAYAEWKGHGAAVAE